MAGDFLKYGAVFPHFCEKRIHRQAIKERKWAVEEWVLGDSGLANTRPFWWAARRAP